MVTNGDRPRLHLTATNLASPSDRRARYLAFRSRPKRKQSVLLRCTDTDPESPATCQSTMPTCSDLPGRRAAALNQGRGTGPCRKRSCSLWTDSQLLTGSPPRRASHGVEQSPESVSGPPYPAGSGSCDGGNWESSIKSMAEDGECDMSPGVVVTVTPKVDPE
jgi:hypothetical protein